MCYLAAGRNWSAELACLAAEEVSMYDVVACVRCACLNVDALLHSLSTSMACRLSCLLIES